MILDTNIITYSGTAFLHIPTLGEPPAANHGRLRASGHPPAAGPPGHALWVQKRARVEHRVEGLGASRRGAGGLQHRPRAPQAKVGVLGPLQPGGREAPDPRVFGGASPGPRQGRCRSSSGPCGETRECVQPPRAECERCSYGGHTKIIYIGEALKERERNKKKTNE